MVYPHVLRYRKHAEFGCHGLIPGTTFEDLQRGFDEARAAGGHFCLATHYWEVDATLKQLSCSFSITPPVFRTCSLWPSSGCSTSATRDRPRLYDAGLCARVSHRAMKSSRACGSYHAAHPLARRGV